MANIKDLIKSIEAADSSFDEKLAAINQMEETLVSMRAQEEQAVQDNVDLIVEAIKVMERKVENQLEIAKSIVPEKGDKGDKGERGLDGANGQDGKDGRDGINGRDGQDGQDGVSVTDAKIDFDGSLIITLSTGQEINVGEVVAPELQEKIKLVTSGGAGTVLPSQTGNANKYLKTDGTGLSWATVSGGSGTVTSVGGTGTVNGISLSGTVTTSGNLTLGGTLDLSSPPAIGGTTPAAGTFTTLIGGGGSANYGQLTGGATTKAVEFKTLGSDANVSLAIQPKGTGAIDLAAGSSGVNISNGGTVTALTRTANGSSYTGFPSIAISAPTTAGGVQATATPQLVAANGTVVSGGTGYTLSDVLTVTTSGGSSAITLTVTGVSGGVVTTATANSSALTTIPSGTVSVSGGTGSGATFNLLYVIAATFTITAAGSGYVEQPTVTFSGGGGSGAAAYASVGGATTIKSIGSTSPSGGASIIFQTPSSITSGLPAMRILDGSAGYDSYPQIQPASAYTVIQATGNANAALFLSANGTGGVRLGTRGTSLVEQMRVSDTASAVNYVQVTGAATGGTVNISSQGSDASVNLGFTAKSGGVIRFFTGNGTENFRVGSVSSTVNYVTANGSIAGASPSFVSTGTDTNIDLTLTPKGTGNVRFGTYTGTILTPTGYVEIKDSGGTIRRLLVG